MCEFVDFRDSLELAERHASVPDSLQSIWASGHVTPEDLFVTRKNSSSATRAGDNSFTKTCNNECSAHLHITLMMSMGPQLRTFVQFEQWRVGITVIPAIATCSLSTSSFLMFNAYSFLKDYADVKIMCEVH